jgi:acyl-coenzyme A thioesterase PaaI-like protein
MTTAQLGTSFLRPVPGDASELRVVGTVLRRGRTLAFGEVEIFTPDGRLAVHATTTYALL